MTSKYLNTVLTVIAVLLGLNLWTGMHQSPAAQALDPATAAHAQGRTNPAEERREMIRKLDEVIAAVNGVGSKLDSISRDGTVRVQVQNLPDSD